MCYLCCCVLPVLLCVTCVAVCHLLLCVAPNLGLYLDAQAALQILQGRRDIDRHKIILFGRSLGGAVAIHLASTLSHRNK